MTDLGAGPTRNDRLEWIALAVVTALALGIRLYRLTEWSLSDDEYWTWRHSLAFSWSNPRPLLYALNHYLVAPVLGLREGGLRVIPMLAGVAAVPAIYLLLRRLELRLEGLATAALVALGTWHVYWSQFARYYTLVFLFSAVCGLSLIGWVRYRRWTWLLLSVASGLLAVLAHPTALPAVAMGAVIAGLHRLRLARRGGMVWVWALALGVVAVVAAIRYGPILHYWVTRVDSACCHTSLGLALALVDWLTAPVLVCALAGMVYWWWADRGPVPKIVVGCALVPTALFLGLSEVMTVSLSYLFATAPFYFVAAGWLLARLGTAGGTSLVACGVAVVALTSANLVGLASHFRDGGRLPYRDAAHALPSLTAPGDTILTEGTGHLRFYAPELQVTDLPWDSLTLQRMVPSAHAAWVLAPRVDRAGFGYYERQFSEVYGWLQAHCGLVQIFTTPRLDFRRNELQLFRCPDSRGVPPGGRPTPASGIPTAWDR